MQDNKEEVRKEKTVRRGVVKLVRHLAKQVEGLGKPGAHAPKELAADLRAAAVSMAEDVTAGTPAEKDEAAAAAEKPIEEEVPEEPETV